MLRIVAGDQPRTKIRHSDFRRGQSHGLVAAIVFGLLALAFDRCCNYFKRAGRKHLEALSDGAAHISTALAVSLPAAKFVEHQRRFVAVTVLSAVAIDLDHVVAARSAGLIRCMTMPTRPASHSLITVSIGSYAAERLWPGTQSGLALTLGLGSHLLRDLATGGAPLFIPQRIVVVPHPPVALMMLVLGMIGRWHAHHILNPARRRRSNPIVLAPEAVVVGSRAVRAVRLRDHAA
jgi:hypothetical protein